MMTIWRSLGSATPIAAPIAGSAGSMRSIDMAVSAIISAMSAMNSTGDKECAGAPTATAVAEGYCGSDGVMAHAHGAGRKRKQWQQWPQCT